MKERFRSKVSIEPAGCHLWTAGKSKSGYGKFKIGGLQCRAHRVSWELENGPIPAGMKVLHRCDVRACVNPDHLFLGTQDDNMKDMVKKERCRRGEANGRAKLAASDVISIRGSNESNAALARVHGVSESTIRHARTGKNWKYLDALSQ